ncbi:alpha,alpha-trehalase [Patescibacteria group bacterium]|nr:MAG: alpha,alpha-trehalase [Patescibacteria group bacterium]
MITKTKTVLRKIFPVNRPLTPQDVEVAREYIAGYWSKLERSHPKDDDSLVGLPKPYLVPAFEEDHAFDFNEMYYWDTYFMTLGLRDERHKELCLGMLENLAVMFERYGIIPNASRLYLMGRSQPPLLTTFIWDMYDRYQLGKPWLKRYMAIAEAEYQTVWMGTKKPHERQVYRGLSRYYDINYLHDLAETESGWDMTTRFGRRCLDYVPVDLNALLYKYETDFARYYQLMDDKRAVARWSVAASHRKKTMNELMWSNLRGLYFDYNFVKEKRGTVGSLASYYPLWAGLATKEQAKQLVKSLRRFEQRGGLATTDGQALGQLVPGAIPTQWSYPNGWAPLHYLVIQGLEQYGYRDDAARIAAKWLKTNLNWYNQHGVFLEKYNVVDPSKPPVKGLYPSQTGFGWTNAVFEYLCREYVDGR